MFKTSIEQWVVFITVIEEGGFNSAAATLHRSQSSISYAISKLQAQLGITLFYQEGRKMRLTDEGERLREEVIPILKDFERIEAIAKMMASGEESRICLLVDSIFPRKLLFRAIHLFNQFYPNTRVELYDVIRLNPIEHSQFDMAICTSSDGLVTGTKIIDVPLYPVAHPNHPLFLKAPLHLNDLSHYTSIRYQNSHQIKGHELQKKGKYWLVNTLEGAASTIRNQLAYGWLPRDVIEQDLEEQTMAILPIEDGFQSVIPLYFNDGDKGVNGSASKCLKQQLLEVCETHSA
jgi:DNA-binding transcriptional LysR family regulator